VRYEFHLITTQTTSLPSFDAHPCKFCLATDVLKQFRFRSTQCCSQGTYIFSKNAWTRPSQTVRLPSSWTRHTQRPTYDEQNGENYLWGN